MARGFLQLLYLSLVIIILPVFQNHLQLHATLMRTNRRTNASSHMWGGGGIRQKITFILGFIAVSWFRLNSTSYRRSPGSVPLPLCQTCGRESNIGTRLSQCSSVSRHIHSTSTQYSFLSSFSSYPKDKQAKSGNFQLEQFSFGNRENCNFSHHRSFYLPLNYHLLHLPLFFSGFIVSYTTEIWTELTEIRQEV